MVTTRQLPYDRPGGGAGGRAGRASPTTGHPAPTEWPSHQGRPEFTEARCRGQRGDDHFVSPRGAGRRDVNESRWRRHRHGRGAADSEDAADPARVKVVTDAGGGRSLPRAVSIVASRPVHPTCALATPRAPVYTRGALQVGVAAAPPHPLNTQSGWRGFGRCTVSLANRRSRLTQTALKFSHRDLRRRNPLARTSGVTLMNTVPTRPSTSFVTGSIGPSLGKASPPRSTWAPARRT